MEAGVGEDRPRWLGMSSQTRNVAMKTGRGGRGGRGGYDATGRTGPVERGRRRDVGLVVGLGVVVGSVGVGVGVGVAGGLVIACRSAG
jgi:hypothetical protein